MKRKTPINSNLINHAGKNIQTRRRTGPGFEVCALVTEVLYKQPLISITPQITVRERRHKCTCRHVHISLWWHQGPDLSSFRRFVIFVFTTYIVYFKLSDWIWRQRHPDNVVAESRQLHTKLMRTLQIFRSAHTLTVAIASNFIFLVRDVRDTYYKLPSDVAKI